MSYIGSTPTTQSFIAGTDYFNGNGSTVNFTLSRSVNSVNDIEVIVNNVEQIPSGYSVSGTTLTFSAAPSAGTSNVYVRYLSTTNLSLAIPSGTSATFNTVTATTVNTTALTTTNGASIQGLTVGRGAGAVSTNTAVGASALAANSGGSANNSTAVGYNALLLATGGSNLAVGSNALAANTTGDDNTAVGSYAPLAANTTGTKNVAIGRQALAANSTGTNNTAVGYQAGYTNVTGTYNTAVGSGAGRASTTSGNNTLIGGDAGAVLTGGSNTFIGAGVGQLITTGTKNTIIGTYNGNQGSLDIRTANNHIVLSDGDGNPRMYFDNNAVGRIENAAGGTGVLRVRNMTNASGDAAVITSMGTNTQNTSSYFFIGSTPGVGDKIYIYGNGNIQNTNGSYGAFSDIKLKENIVDATPKLADLMQVRVRNYNLKTDPSTKQIGVVAQELETVFPALIDESPDRDEDGNELGTTTKSVKYSVFVPMLIKAMQEQQALITALTTRITALENNNATQ